ncbi:hypothetical protein LTR66_002450 [Elasticomyces elasticus]|nr:hypothetical protein LTR66_002450 [Elasticomyces elasticus]
MVQKGQTRVAVVGSGMAGLVTAYLLHRDIQSRYAVTIFEGVRIATPPVHVLGTVPADVPQGNVLSLDSASLTIESPSRGHADRVDLPMRAFAGGFYTNLKAMYDYLGVEYHSQPFLFSFSKAAAPSARSTHGEKGSSYFIHSSNNHRIPPVRPEGISTAAWSLEILYLLVCYTWFSACCFFVEPRLASKKNVCETFDEYLRRIRLPQYFVTYYLLPLISSVTTCSHKALLCFPAADVTEYRRRTHRAHHYTVSHGVQDVQRKLAEGIPTNLSAMVSSVGIQHSGVKISWRDTEDTRSLTTHEDLFDRVILAVSPDVVGKIFRSLQYEMAQIPTASVESVVHADYDNLGEWPGQLGGQNLCHTAAHTIHLRTSTEGIHRTESIHVQPSGALVTTCPFGYIDPVHIVKLSRFTRVLRTPESRRVVNSIFSGHTSIEEIDGEKPRPRWKNGDENVWLVGGWCWDGPQKPSTSKSHGETRALGRFIMTNGVTSQYVELNNVPHASLNVVCSIKH